MGNSLLIEQSNLQYTLILKNTANLKIIRNNIYQFENKKSYTKKEAVVYLISKWCSGYHYCKNFIQQRLNSGSTPFKILLTARGGLRWQEPLKMDLAGNKA